MENIKERNPRNTGMGFRTEHEYGLTPLDMAAKNGHLKICGLIQGYLTY